MGTLYTGVSKNPTKRLAQHNGERAGGAKNTRRERPWVLAAQQPFRTRAIAMGVEARVKKQPKDKKITYLKEQQWT